MSPDIFRRAKGLPCEGVGAKKFGMSLDSKPGKSNFLGGISRLIAGISRRCPKSLKKKFVFNCWPLVAQTVFFGKPCFCPLPKTGLFNENGKNRECAFYPPKTRDSLLRPPKTTKMAGVTQMFRDFREARGSLTPSHAKIRRVHLATDPDTSVEKYRDTPPISIDTSVKVCSPGPRGGK